MQAICPKNISGAVLKVKPSTTANNVPTLISSSLSQKKMWVQFKKGAKGRASHVTMWQQKQQKRASFAFSNITEPPRVIVLACVDSRGAGYTKKQSLRTGERRLLHHYNTSAPRTDHRNVQRSVKGVKPIVSHLHPVAWCQSG